MAPTVHETASRSSLHARVSRIALALAVLVLPAACSSKSNPDPPGTIVIETGPQDSAIVDAPVTLDGGETGPVADSSLFDTATPDTARDVAEIDASWIDAAACSAGGCWNCPPLVNEHFLNRCHGSTVQCSPFDNAQRIPSTLWVSGPLPPVP